MAVFLAPMLFKVTRFDNTLKLGVIVAATLLFAAVLRRNDLTNQHRPRCPFTAKTKAHQCAEDQKLDVVL